MSVPCKNEVTEPAHAARSARADAVEPAQPCAVVNARAVEGVAAEKFLFHRHQVVAGQAGGQGLDEVSAVQPARRGGVLDRINRAHARGAVGQRHGERPHVGGGAVAHAAANKVLPVVGHAHGDALTCAFAVGAQFADRLCRLQQHWQH